MLYDDEGSRGLHVRPMPERMRNMRLLKAAQVEAIRFRSTLRPHHLGMRADGTTALDCAVAEHGLLAAWRLCSYIRYDKLSGVLAMSERKAEDECQLMAYEGCMQAKLDLVEGVVSL